MNFLNSIPALFTSPIHSLIPWPNLSATTMKLLLLRSPKITEMLNEKVSLKNLCYLNIIEWNLGILKLSPLFGLWQDWISFFLSHYSFLWQRLLELHDIYRNLFFLGTHLNHNCQPSCNYMWPWDWVLALECEGKGGDPQEERNIWLTMSSRVSLLIYIGLCREQEFNTLC